MCKKDFITMNIKTIGIHLLIAFGSLSSCNNIKIITKETPSFFSNINDNAQTITFTINSNLDISPISSGHIQGIQKTNTGEYVLSGSSNEMAYLIFVNKNQEIYKLVDISENYIDNKGNLTKLNHASGFQIIDDQMVIGLEKKGNKKSGSLICTYDLKGNLVSKIVSRKGNKNGSGTAGAVGFANLSYNNYLIIAGSWNCKTVDFYSSLDLTTTSYEHMGSWQKKTADKSDWADNNWGKYQNLNTYKDIDGSIYILAFKKSIFKEYIDLYSIDLELIKSDISNSIKKICTKQMHCKKNTSFRYGAGIFTKDEFNIYIMSVEKEIAPDFRINVF